MSNEMDAPATITVEETFAQPLYDPSVVHTDNRRKISAYQAKSQSSVDSDDHNYERSVLHLLFEETVEKLTDDEGKPQNVSISKIENKEIETTTPTSNNQRPFFTILKNMTKFSQNDKTLKIEKITCNNCQKSQSVIEKITQELLELQGRWNEKIIECATLKNENQSLKAWIKSENIENQGIIARENEDNTDLIEEIKSLKEKLVETQCQLETKRKELADIQKQKLSDNADIEKQILEEVEERCRNMETKLNIERKLRERREAEIAHVYHHIERNSEYNRKQIEDNANSIKQMEATHKQEIEILTGIMKHKDEELAFQQASVLRNPVQDNGEQEKEDKTSVFKEMKIRNLEQSLQLKEKHLVESYTEIFKLQEELQAKRRELEEAKVPNSNIQDSLKEQLHNLKKQFIEIVNVLDPKNSSSDFKQFLDVRNLDGK